MRPNNRRIILSFLFVTLNILNILDKVITWIALKNPNISELNPVALYTIQKFGVTTAMTLHLLLGFVIFYIIYRIVVAKRLWCERQNMSPETFFTMLNVVFFFIVANNIFWILYRG